jgi:hypothetical protein
MPEVGMEGQLKLKAARVLCIGAGGLGSPLSLYLAAAGVGTLGIVDFDVVDFTNLQRQIIHSTAESGGFILHEAVAQFERALGAYVGVRHAVAVSDCTNAMLLGFRSSGVQPGDEIILPGHASRVISKGRIDHYRVTGCFSLGLHVAKP